MLSLFTSKKKASTKASKACGHKHGGQAAGSWGGHSHDGGWEGTTKEPGDKAEA
jgi:hypothetical protein